MDIRFFYQNNQRSYKHEAIITSFAKLVANVIELPEIIEVCLYPMNQNVYGGIDNIRVNRLGINIQIPLEAVPKILTHELIHVNQKHKGLLKITRDGMCYWHGIPYTNVKPEDMRYEEYTELPWEVDVQNRLDNVFKEALHGYNGKP